MLAPTCPTLRARPEESPVDCPDDEWITPTDAAVYLGVSRDVIYRRLADGTLPCRYYRVGRLWRVNREDVKAMTTGGTP